MLPPVIPSVRSRSSGRRRLDARPALRVRQQHILNRFGQNGIQRRQHRLGQLVAHRVGVGAANSECGVCKPNTVIVCSARVTQAGRQDARVGQRMAVGLARQWIWHLPGGRPRICGIQLGPGLVDVERPGERLFGRDAVVAQPGQPAQHHVHLDLRARGQWRRRCSPSRPASTAGVTPASTNRARIRCSSSPLR